MTDVLAEVRARLGEHFDRIGAGPEPAVASITFLGAESIDVLRFGPDADGMLHHVSLGCSRHAMLDPMAMVVDSASGPRAEVVVALRGSTPMGLARSIAIVAASPAVEGLVLVPDALVDLETPLWEGAPFTAVLLMICTPVDGGTPLPVANMPASAGAAIGCTAPLALVAARL